MLRAGANYSRLQDPQPPAHFVIATRPTPDNGLGTVVA